MLELQLSPNEIQNSDLNKKKGTLRFITCGSVDDGKSTLIGRLLLESQNISEDHLSNLASESKRHGTQGDELDFALLLDGLTAEREQGITIDVAYRFFSTPRRKFIVGDTPGHEEYTRNMITAASTADAAIILVDIQKGLLPQTRRHLYLLSLIGVKHVALAANKMDLINFDRMPFESLKLNFENTIKNFNFDRVIAIPLSALRGDNIFQKSSLMNWYSGPSITEWLENIPIKNEKNIFSFPVQWVNHPNSDFRGFSGTIASGFIRSGDRIEVFPSRKLSTIKEIISFDGPLTFAQTGDAVTLTLEDQISISRGDVLSSQDSFIEISDQFEATIIWMHESPGLAGRTYDIKLATQETASFISAIKYRINTTSLSKEPCDELKLNEIGVCTLALNRPLIFSTYPQSKTLGGFILIDRITKNTIAAGLISHDLRRAQNISFQPLDITRKMRESLNGHPGKVIWLTGLSGSGKSTLANHLEQALHLRGKRTYILDGDNIRRTLNRDLGFTDGDRVENIRRVAEVARLMMDAGIIVITSLISPFQSEREMARHLIGKSDFIEVFVDTPLKTCEERDSKGLYKKARKGEIPNLTGIGSPYEPPQNPNFTLKPDTPLDDFIPLLLQGAELW